MKLKSLFHPGLFRVLAVTCLLNAFAVAHTFAIHQVSWLSDDGGYLVQNSEWGTANIQFVSGDEAEFFPCGSDYCGYIQVVTSSGINAMPHWAVANMLLILASGDLDGRLPDSFAFNLGLPRGYDAGSDSDYRAGVLITPTPLSSMPAIPLNAVPVTQENWLWSNGYAGEVVPSIAQNFVAAADPPDEVLKAKIAIKEEEVVAIAEEINRCGPGGATRSLSYLAQQKLIKLKQTPLEAYDTLKSKNYMNTDPVKGTTNINFEKGKNAYSGLYKLPIETDGTYTSTFIVKDVMEPMKAGADVEVIFDKGKNELKQDMMGHIAFVSEIELTRDPKTEDVKSFKVKIIDSPVQDGKTKKNRTLWLNFTVTKEGTKPEMVTLEGWGTGASFTNFFVEKVTK
jgi:hypothetical protein